MKFILMRIFCIVTFCMIYSCNTTIKKTEPEVTTNNNRKQHKLSKKDSLKKTVKGVLQKEFDTTILSNQNLEIKNQKIIIVDLDDDGLLDGVAFSPFFNKPDNSFKNTVITYYKNNGKELIFAEAILPETYICPRKNALEGIGHESVPRIRLHEIKPSSLGLINHSLLQESSLELREGKLSYSVLVGGDYYDTNSAYEVVEKQDYKYVILKGGIEYRNKPDGEVLGKIAYGTQVHITGTTGLKKMEYVNGKKIVFEWVQIELDRFTKEKAFVLDRYLVIESETDFRSQVSSTNYKMVRENYYKFVNAKNGLVYRDKPEGDIIGKFNYGTKVHITGKTGLVKTVYDDKERIAGEWVEVQVNGDFTEKVFVFNGYLVKEEEINYRLAALKSEVVFEDLYDKGVILPGEHLVYNKELQEISSITIDTITEVTILKKTKNKRPIKNEDEYCKWANYVSVNLKGKDLILFGNTVLVFSVKLTITLETGVKVNYVETQNYAMESSDDNGLTGCDDYSDVYIKSDNTYHQLYYLSTDNKNKGKKKIIVHDAGMREHLTKIRVKNDTININMIQNFQEGKSFYTLKVFRNNGWKCIETKN